VRRARREREMKPLSTSIATVSVERPKDRRYYSIPDLMRREEGEKRQ
jgi:hypothetical protein